MAATTGTVRLYAVDVIVERRWSWWRRLIRRPYLVTRPELRADFGASTQVIAQGPAD